MCLKPIKLIKKDAVVPCGRCPKCVARRVSAWSFRLLQEDRVSQSSIFLTLTYDTKFVPILSNGLLTLDKRDLQLFFKRLRKNHSNEDVFIRPIKYYAVGEYGGKTRRPHYHVLLFNANIELIDKSWQRGSIYCGKVSGASVGYTLKYMSKNKKKFRISEDDNRLPEFACMSKGLGLSYLENKEAVEWHMADPVNRMYCVAQGGAKLSMPRYFKDRLYYEQERANIAAAQAIIQNQKQLEKLENYSSKDFRNEMAAIDAAFDRMYQSSLKTKI